MYYFFGLLILSIQVYLAVHAYNTGRETWIFFILLVPVAGALVYLFVAWIPDLERQIERRSYREPQSRSWTPPPDRTPSSTRTEMSSATTTRKMDDAAQQLKVLKGMLDEGLITEEDYETKKTEILSRM
jgi:hypothetical protein